MIPQIHLNLGEKHADVSPNDLLNVCQKRGIVRFNPRDDGMFKERVLHSSENTTKSWLEVIFKLNFKELWERSAINEHPNLDVKTKNFEIHSEFVNQTVESISGLTKANGIEMNTPQHLQVDSRYFAKWELFDITINEAVDHNQIPQCSPLCKDILNRGVEAFAEMQVRYQENFGSRVVIYNYLLQNPNDKIDHKGASSSEGSLPFSHIGLGLCAHDRKIVNKNIPKDERELAKTIKIWSGDLDIDPSRGIGTSLMNVFLGSPIKKKLQKQSDEDFQKQINNELLVLRQKIARYYGYGDGAFDEYDSIPSQLVPVYDWLVYFGFGEVLSDDFVEQIKTNEIKEALKSMEININNIGKNDVINQMSSLWFDNEEVQAIQAIKEENRKLKQEVEDLKRRLQQQQNINQVNEQVQLNEGKELAERQPQANTHSSSASKAHSQRKR